jgi:hypothetical protein
MSMSARSTVHPQPTPYADLNVVLHELVMRAQGALGANFVGAYLQGSFAVGDSDAYSDVDFLIILKEDVSDAQRSLLQDLHSEVFQLPSAWARHLEGSYIPKTALTHLPPPQREFQYLDHGSRELVRSNHDDSLVVYWVLREKGITLIGPEPRSLLAPVPCEALRREVLETMRTWREHWLANPDSLNNRFYQPFAVLSYCRMLQTLQTGTVKSKPAGAAWARATLGGRWRTLIQRALDDRPGDAAWRARQPAPPAELASTWEFMQYVVDLGGKWMVRNLD